MKLIFTSYSSSPEYHRPEDWLKRIEGYTGMLENLNRENKVIGIERINYEGEYHQHGVDYHFIRQKKKTVYFPRRLHRLIKKLQPDVVFINGLIFPLQIIQLRIALGRSVKIVLLHRAERPFKGLKRYLQKLADNCVNAYFFASFTFGNEWRSTISHRKIYDVITVSSVFYTIDRSDALKITKVIGAPVFLWVGMLISLKDPLTVIKAFLEFVAHRPGAKLFMIYQSAELLPEIHLLLENNNQWRDAIILVGIVPHSELLYWYNSADFFISASRYEGTGVAVCEAMSCGCVPILTNIESFAGLTGHGKCGLIFEPGSQNDLFKRLMQTNEIDMEKASLSVLGQFREELSFDAIADKINRIIRSF